MCELVCVCVCLWVGVYVDWYVCACTWIGAFHLSPHGFSRTVGSGSTLAPSSHPGETPHLSAQAVNIAQFTGVVASSGEFPKTALTKVHGIMMLISWPLLAVTGIFFAAWMKPALGPPPMPPKWFTVSFASLRDSEVDCLCLGLCVEFVI